MSDMQSTQCLNCAHFLGGFSDGFHCTAYPFGGEEIPEDIVTGVADHREPYKGDHGIRYKDAGKIKHIHSD